MQYKKILLSLLLSVPGVSFCMEDSFMMPSKEVLGYRLVGIGLGCFVAVTGIEDELAEREVNATDVLTAVTWATYRYFEYLKKANIYRNKELRPMSDDERKAERERFNLTKPSLFKALLQDHPKALLELEKKGFYSPTEKKEARL